MQTYIDVVRDVLNTGQLSENRTGINTIFKHGLMMKFDMANGFPAVTTKKLAYRSVFAEMLGFFNGIDNAADFRALGCNVWDTNANETQSWLDNPYRNGKDALGRIYGVQARKWSDGDDLIDQLYGVYEKLCNGVDDRRLVVSHWNVGDLNKMALPPCHMMYQFGLRNISGRNKLDKRDTKYLDMCVYVRSNDIGLGMPFNIAGYAWLLHVMSKITGHIPGEMTYFSWNYHIYVNHIDQLKIQIERSPKLLPCFAINPDIRTFEDVENSTAFDYELHGYEYHPRLQMEMAK